MMTNDNRKMLLVLGTGRSGTCWVGDILAQHPEITGYVEPKPLFSWVTQVAVNQRDEETLLPAIFQEYERLFNEATPNHLSDKSHPAVWIAERLAERFPNSYFVGVMREAIPTVASMLRHPGVRRWCEEWQRYPVPNRFLGIDEDNVEWYRQASIVERCALRWLVHEQELNRLEKSLGERYILVRYEELVTNSRRMLQKLQRFIGLSQEFSDPSPSVETLSKWQQQLTQDDLRKIQSVLEMHGVAGVTP